MPPARKTAQRPGPALPSSVKIGHTNWRVSSADLFDSYGVTYKRDTRIAVTVKQSADNLRDTLLHEVLHALLETSGVMCGDQPFISRESEESVVAILSPWLLAVLRDNPQLVEFLLAV